MQTAKIEIWKGECSYDNEKLSNRKSIEIFLSWFNDFNNAVNDHTYIDNDEYYDLDDKIDALVKYATNWGYTIA